MIVRTPDGEKLGRVASVDDDGLTVERGLVFKHRFAVPFEHVIAVDDERDELIARPVPLPESEREIREMWFGSPDGEEEREIRREEADFAEELRKDPHLVH